MQLYELNSVNLEAIILHVFLETACCTGSLEIWLLLETPAHSDESGDPCQVRQRHQVRQARQVVR